MHHLCKWIVVLLGMAIVSQASARGQDAAEADADRETVAGAVAIEKCLDPAKCYSQVSGVPFTENRKKIQDLAKWFDGPADGSKDKPPNATD
jgi:hypothetical protein